MKRRLEVELDDHTKKCIDDYARDHGMRLPFAYGKLLQEGLKIMVDGNNG